MNDLIFKTFVFSFPRTVLSFISQKWGLVFIARGKCREIEWSWFSTRSRTLDLLINSVIIPVWFNTASPDKHTRLGLINVFVKGDLSTNPITLSVGSETKKDGTRYLSLITWHVYSSNMKLLNLKVQANLMDEPIAV